MDRFAPNRCMMARRRAADKERTESGESPSERQSVLERSGWTTTLRDPTSDAFRRPLLFPLHTLLLTLITPRLLPPHLAQELRFNANGRNLVNDQNELMYTANPTTAVSGLRAMLALTSDQVRRTEERKTEYGCTLYGVQRVCTVYGVVLYVVWRSEQRREEHSSAVPCTLYGV